MAARGAADTTGGESIGPGREKLVMRPGLFGRLAATARVSVVSGSAGSGKSVLLRSWIGQTGLTGRVAWAAARDDERDPQGFWVSVFDAMRRSVAGSALVRPLTPAPDLDGWTLVERLLADLAPLPDPLWLVVDDVHELSAEALRQLELLVLRAPPELRFVLSTRHDVRLGLHRLRLEGSLAEIRERDLRFSRSEAGELFKAAGLKLSASTITLLHQRTEGWVAGLRLAALSLSGHPDPDGFAAGFSGSERTVAEFLLVEVLERQDAAVRRLLLRTSVLERINGELADVLTGGGESERILQDLERANAFVVALDAGRSWFRYHRMFADLLQQELRREAPEEVAGLHSACAGWFAEHGHAVEAVRHAQAAEDWASAAAFLADAWPSLYLDGRAVTIHELLTAFPAEVRAANAELAILVAADEAAFGVIETAEWYLGVAERRASSVAPDRRGQSRMLLSMARLLAARRRGDQEAVIVEARRVQHVAEGPDPTHSGLSDDLRAFASISVAITEDWTDRQAPAQQRLTRAVELARRTGRPYLEFSGLAYLAALDVARSRDAAAQAHAEQVIELARRHGWTDEPPATIAYAIRGVALVWRARPEEAEPWLHLAERSLTVETEPSVGAGIHYIRGMLELVRGRDAEALAALRAAESLTARLDLDGPYYLSAPTRALLLHALVRLGEIQRAERMVEGLDKQERARGEVRVAVAALKAAQDDPEGAIAELAPVEDDDSVRYGRRTWRVAAFVLEAAARDALGDTAAAERLLERSLDLAEPDGAVWHFLLCPPPEQLLERHARRTAHAWLVAEIQSMLAARRLPSPSSSCSAQLPAPDPLSDSEIRVLRYLPTNLTAREIGGELGVSPNTVRTHIRSLYTKLGTHSRSDTVARARSLGLLAPSAR
ncbi:LuxR C-terminal-related transcriptional regulator [Catenulispora pinisilvae]|uniref:LuxR C-terminal-related transcriptional regulator n=1 Tax=Catenulispora pinisilvae TaxID=2705253 RepID=UPI001891FF87|nr:LuxR C-terminal-related transcriptional regulator [Catenulispora pinisilvae]